MFWVFIPEKLIRIMDLLKKKKKEFGPQIAAQMTEKACPC